MQEEYKFVLGDVRDGKTVACMICTAKVDPTVIHNDFDIRNELIRAISEWANKTEEGKSFLELIPLDNIILSDISEYIDDIIERFSRSIYSFDIKFYDAPESLDWWTNLYEPY
jgi:hypothetical protein